ncbi:MAG: glycoside hydrolase family 3 C-terminal domain-containing protein [Opitutaceae bacterium]
MNFAKILPWTPPALLALVLAVSAGAAPSGRDIDRRTDAIMSRMTLGQKIDLIGGVDGFYIRGYPKLGWPRLKMADGPMGVRNGGPATAFPGGIALAATWDPEMARRIGQGLGRDARAKGVNFLLGPGVNIYRGPMSGRNFEFFGEDPYLGSRIAVAYIEGVQSQGVAATIKHFVADNSEYARHRIDVRIDERTEHEIYLPIFEAAVKEAHVGAIMDAYNLVNGSYMTQNAPLNIRVVRKEWGFKGIIMSDWGATYDGVAAANGGLDLEMPDGRFMNRETLLPAIREGKVSVATIDKKVRHIVRTAVAFGFLDRPQEDLRDPRFSEENRAIALQGALESMVLLKNAGSVLPLSRSAVKTIAVLGPDAYPPVPTGGGSAQVAPFVAVSALEGISRELAGSGRVLYNPGIVSFADVMNDSAFTTDPAGRHPGLRGEYYPNVDFSGQPLVRIDPTIDFHWSGAGFPPNAQGRFAVRWTGYFRPGASGPYVWILRHTGGNDPRLYLDGRLIAAPIQGRSRGTSFCRTTLEGGRSYAVKYEVLSSGGQVGLGVIARSDLITSEARRMAARADAVVVCVGFDPDSEGEGTDRSFELGAGQDELIAAAAAANPRTIVVLTAGGSVDALPWIDRVPVFIHAWYTGQESGTALAKILFGEADPSGHLPITFERRWQDNPAYRSWYPNGPDNTVTYREGVFVGYRGYERSGIKPLFPFGYGLSYTSFAFRDLAVAPAAPRLGQDVTVSFTVENTGRREGAEVAQVYLGNPGARVERPARELKGFARVDLRPGESRRVAVTLDPRSMSYWDTGSHAWRQDPGRFVVYIGDSCEDTALTRSYRVDR